MVEDGVMGWRLVVGREDDELGNYRRWCLIISLWHALHSSIAGSLGYLSRGRYPEIFYWCE